MAHFTLKTGGFSLIELLVSVLIIAIAVLGLVTLQTASLRGNNAAYLRTQAVFIAGDIISRMMSNPDGVEAGAYAGADSASPPSDPGCITTGCTSILLADQDIREWSQYFSNVLGVTNYSSTLPNASGTITATGNLYEVSVSWSEASAAGVEPQTLTVQVNL